MGSRVTTGSKGNALPPAANEQIAAQPLSRFTQELVCPISHSIDHCFYALFGIDPLRAVHRLVTVLSSISPMKFSLLCQHFDHLFPHLSEAILVINKTNLFEHCLSPQII